MQKNEARRRRTRKTTFACVAALCASASVFVASASAQIIKLKTAAPTLEQLTVANEAAKERQSAAKANAEAVNAAKTEFEKRSKERVLETRAAFYPTQLEWGDAAYFATVERNILDETREIPAPYEYNTGKNWDFGKIRATADGIPGEYLYANNEATINAAKGDSDFFFSDEIRAVNNVEIAPGEERVRTRIAIEFPPLKDANEPFWKAVREKLQNESRVVLQLRIEFRRWENAFDCRRDAFKTEVVLSRRTPTEMRTLDRWCEGMSQKTAASEKKRDGDMLPLNNEFASYIKTRKVVENPISLNGATCDVAWFACGGNCELKKPTTLKDWRGFELIFKSGTTLRDEITFVRLQLEYYAASDGKERIAALEKLVDWLAERPEPQRVALTANIAANSWYFRGKPLEERSRVLLDALERADERLRPNCERFDEEQKRTDYAASQVFEPFPELFGSQSRRVVWPEEAFFGDVVYFAAIERNISPTLGGAASVPDIERFKRHFVGAVEVEAEGVDAKYRFLNEFWPEETVDWRQDDVKTLLPPGEERTVARFAIEFPPLEDWNDVFWTAVREKLATEKRVVLRFTFSYRLGGKRETVESQVVLKPRPEKEAALISSWYDATAPELLPQRVGQHQLKETPRTLNGPMRIAKSGVEGIEIDASGELFSPWLFLRVGNRKPSDPNNPTTVDGWRSLENEFEASTLRDEITFARLQLEYYAASTKMKSDVASQALVSWLAARPEAQRVVLAASVFSKAPQFEKTRLKAKYAALVEAIWREPEIARLLEKRDCVAETTEEETVR